MANALYPNWKSELMKGTANRDLDNDTATDGPFCALVDTGTYTYSAAHEFYSSLSGIVGTDQRISTPTVDSVAEATFDGDNLTYSSVTGASVEALVIYRKNSGANTTWALVAYIDTSVTGLPVTPNGGDITVTWNASGIFSLSDVRAKEDIRVVGEINGLDVCRYRYRGGAVEHLGLIAQDVEAKVPGAVIELEGRKLVNYEVALAA